LDGALEQSGELVGGINLGHVPSPAQRQLAEEVSDIVEVDFHQVKSQSKKAKV
jgi:hypothetical protein